MVTPTTSERQVAEERRRRRAGRRLGRDRARLRSTCPSDGRDGDAAARAPRRARRCVGICRSAATRCRPAGEVGALRQGGRCDAVKIEMAGVSGGLVDKRESVSRARAIVAAGIPLMGHVGLTPQSASALGGYRAQGRTARRPCRWPTTRSRSRRRAASRSCSRRSRPRSPRRSWSGCEIPVIGIGAGASTDGQVLVFHDLLGIYEGHAPRFAKRFAEVKRAMVDGRAGLRRRGPRAAASRPRSTRYSDRSGRAGAVPRGRRPGQGLGRRRLHEPEQSSECTRAEPDVGRVRADGRPQRPDPRVHRGQRRHHRHHPRRARRWSRPPASRTAS